MPLRLTGTATARAAACSSVSVSCSTLGRFLGLPQTKFASSLHTPAASARQTAPAPAPAPSTLIFWGSFLDRCQPVARPPPIIMIKRNPTTAHASGHEAPDKFSPPPVTVPACSTKTGFECISKTENVEKWTSQQSELRL